MGIHDRRYPSSGGDFGEGGGFRRAMRRIFVEGDSFFSWALPLFTVPRSVPGIGGIRVRIHLLYILFIVLTLLGTLRKDALGFVYVAPMMVTLFVLVLLHEFGHCWACRKVGGEADDVLMWPLGGLASCRPPHNWRSSLITTLGGPGVNAVLMPILGAALLAAGAGWGAVVFNPFDPGSALRTSWFDAHWKSWLWSAYYTNAALLAFNVLLPMFPMDGGRIVQELLWKQIGYRRSMMIACNLGLVMAVVVGMVGVFTMASGGGSLFGIALFAGITCYQQKQVLAMQDDEPDWAESLRGGASGGYRNPGPAESRIPDKAYEAALKRQQKDREVQIEVDRVLDKIREQGMASLSRKEKAILKDATERKRSSE